MITDCLDTLPQPTAELIEKIIIAHSLPGDSVRAKTATLEEKALALIRGHIDEGETGLYPLLALLSASNDWHEAVIVRLSQFQDLLMEGVGKGTLAPDDELGWMWLGVAAETNDPETFMTDMDRYYDLLASAAENDDPDAMDIMLTVWPPEQIIEED